MMAKAAFLDRDGVINRDTGYVHRAADLELLPGVVDGLRLLQQAGYLLIVVTNQSGVARGLFSEADYHQFTALLRQRLQAAGVQLTAVYHCFHLDNAPLPAYALACDCRKPRPGMILQGLREHGVDAGQSLLVGDRGSDIQAGRNAGLGRCYLIAPAPASPAGAPAHGADAVFANLADCARHALASTSTAPDTRP